MTRFPLSRRTFIGGSLATAAALALPGEAIAAPQTVPAVNFYNALGLNAHAWYVTNPWPQRLVELGVPNVRGKVGTSRDFITKLGPFFANGGRINSTLVASSGDTLDKTAAEKNLAFLKQYVGVQRVSGVEGPNEYNNGHPPNWTANLRDFCHWLHDTVRADASFREVPIIAPSIWKRLLADYQALGDISAFVDKGCIHYYSGNRRPTLTGGGTMESSLRNAAIIAPGKPIWMTETGWQAPTGNQPISLRAQAKYVLRDYFDAFGYGVEKLFMYQLMDDGKAGGDFGLTDLRANPKPSFNALKNLAALVKDRYVSSGALDYSFSGAPASLKSMALSKSDGSFLLALWLDVDSWNRGRDIETALPVTVNLAKAVNFEIYQPTFSAEAQTVGAGNMIKWFAADQLTLIRIAA